MKLKAKVFNTRPAIITGGMFATLMAFVIIWCAGTTFRAMSDWMLYVVNIFAALLLSMPAVMARKVWIQIIIMVLLDGLLISNLMYCRTYLTAIPPDSYLLAGNLADFTASVADSLRLADLAFPIITIITALLALRARRDSWTWSRPRYVCITLAAGLTAWMGLIPRGGFYKEYDRLTESCYYSTTGVPSYTVAGHIIYNLMSRTTTLTPELKNEVDRWFYEKERVRSFSALPHEVAPRQNLVVILLESFESWLVDTRIDGKEITPYINSLVADSTTLYRGNMLTQVASGRSIDCQLLLTSGLLPMLNSVYSMKYPATDYPSLCKALKENRDARSMILTCDKPVTWNQEVIARSMGYDSLLHRSSWDIDEVIGNPAKLSDGSFMRQSTELLKRNGLGIDGHAFMLTFVTYSGHNPFRLPEELKDPGFKFDESKYPARMTDYVTMAHYTDSCLATLVEYLKSRPDYDKTLILITGDHEGLAADRGDILKSPAAREIVSPLQMTPFLLLNSPVTGRSDAIMGQIDMYPTLLAMLGLDGYYWKGMGQNILTPGKAEVAISSMTGEIVGDTTTVAPAVMENLRRARRVSDAIITHDMLRNP